MTIGDALHLGAIDAADREILLSKAVSADRTWILAYPETSLTAEQERIFLTMVKRREAHEPVAYITGHKEFYGRTFIVRPGVLIPRPATEILIDTARSMIAGRNVERVHDADNGIVIWSERKTSDEIRTIVDVGTGSGCIAVTLALECPNVRVIATDIAADALVVAADNIRLHHVENRVELRTGSMLEPVMNIDVPFLLVSNPPYIPSDIDLDADVAQFEPHGALFAGKEGTEVIRPLIQAARQNPYCVGFVIECRREQVTNSDPT